jgi:protein-tyrosine phosphatase
MQVGQALSMIEKQLNENKLVQIDTSEDSYYFGTIKQLISICNSKCDQHTDGWTWISDSDVCLKRKFISVEFIQDVVSNFQRVHKENVLRIVSNDEVIYEYLKLDCNEIIPNLLMGSIEALKTARYDCVVNCTTNIKKPNHIALENYLQLNWLDSPDQYIITAEFMRALITIRRWLNIDKKIVLVHCEQGISRSGACVLAYLLEYRDCLLEYKSFQDICDFLVSKRGCAKPNIGFIRQLKEWYASNHVREDIFE